MDSFGARRTLRVGDRAVEIFALEALERAGLSIGHLPYALRVLLENLVRNEDGRSVSAADVESVARWDPAAPPEREIAFLPARVVLQDFTGVPCVVDLAAMRDAMAALGGSPARINPLVPVELVIDHSVQVDVFGTRDAFARNVELEFERNRERYAFLRWGQSAFQNLKVVPPGTGIVHQVNLEYLSRVVFADAAGRAYPDTLVGTDSHTTMVNGLGVVGWGVGGIEAEAAMLGQPISMLVPRVVGVRLTGALRPGATATDLVLVVTQMLRKHGVVGRFVEFFGPGLAELPLADRATISNMCPEYGATCAMFPVDAETIRYLRLTGRSEEQVQLVEAYLRAQGLFHVPGAPEARYSETLALDLGSVEPSLAGPRRPQDRVPLSQAADSFRRALPDLGRGVAADASVEIEIGGERAALRHGSVVIAAITSCTNTSNPSVMMAAGLLAKKAALRGLETRPWVKTSLAPGSQVVTGYLKAAGLLSYLEQLRFSLVGYGCTTCIGNSGPLPEPVAEGIESGGLVVCSVLSGNRNFEARVHPAVRANYLMSPPLVVAYALVGRMDVDLAREPLGTGSDGKPVHLRDVWPTPQEVRDAVERYVDAELFRSTYADVFRGDARWNALPVPAGERFVWDPESTYVRHPPYFEGMTRDVPAEVDEIRGARVLAWVGDSVTTDHISPAGSIARESAAELYLLAHKVGRGDFNSYGARRGNHEIMMRGTFANVRLKNFLAPGTEGPVTLHLPDGEPMSIFDAAMRYRAEGTPLVVLAGQEYGTGSSRDWAAKGPRLLGVRAVIAESYERIHRSNLVGMGILPLEFAPGESAKSLGLSGRELYDVLGLREILGSKFAAGRSLRVRARSDAGTREFEARVRIDTPTEADYLRHGGILPYVLRQLLQ
ncbi:MAG TPA: aconitate hydratase AcnA [Myxococcota bacterium]|nr:aconitate hydratase AcnA [Myxococcota bacterium]